MAKATVEGLKRLRRPEDVARARGESIDDVLPPKRVVEALEEETAPAVAEVTA